MSRSRHHASAAAQIRGMNCVVEVALRARPCGRSLPCHRYHCAITFFSRLACRAISRSASARDSVISTTARASSRSNFIARQFCDLRHASRRARPRRPRRGDQSRGPRCADPRSRRGRASRHSPGRVTAGPPRPGRARGAASALPSSAAPRDRRRRRSPAPAYCLRSGRAAQTHARPTRLGFTRARACSIQPAARGRLAERLDDTAPVAAGPQASLERHRVEPVAVLGKRRIRSVEHPGYAGTQAAAAGGRQEGGERSS